MAPQTAGMQKQNNRRETSRIVVPGAAKHELWRTAIAHPAHLRALGSETWVAFGSDTAPEETLRTGRALTVSGARISESRPGSLRGQARPGQARPGRPPPRLGSPAPHGRLCRILNTFVLSLQTTGLVGLAVAENPHERLRILYTKILGVLQNIPKDAAYRKYTEQIVNQRFNLVQTETDVQKLEDKLNSGRIEEVIVQAENELSLARKMIQWKPWEPLVEEPPSDQWRWPI
ncbi:PREDICTED: NADH dehydrogenase [ubiquinone] 1 alpha subcomplex subunit 5 [Nipponia nippon]|nr:PREDICTED: NADH dehydrogenase [ubiquinone] 1 alpha subcomplex subunit 5 [Nipponia nippon]